MSAKTPARKAANAAGLTATISLLFVVACFLLAIWVEEPKWGWTGALGIVTTFLAWIAWVYYDGLDEHGPVSTHIEPPGTW